MSNATLATSLFVHLVSTALWIGGLLVTMILVNPQVRRALADSPNLYRTLSRLRNGFYPISNLCLAALITTGLFQMTADPNYDGFLTIENTWSQVMLVKHIAIGIMAILGLSLQYGVAPALERYSLLLDQQKGTDETSEAWARLRQREVILTWTNGLLGLSIVAMSAYLGIL